MAGIQCPRRNQCLFQVEWRAESMAGTQCQVHRLIPIRHQCSVGFQAELKVVPRSRLPDWVELPDWPGAKLRRWGD